MFNKIVVVEPVLLNETGYKKLKDYCKELVVFDNPTISEEDTIKRIADADCILVSYKTAITKTIIDSSKKLKFVCMCCSYYGAEFAKVDTNYLTSKNIPFSYLKGHGDNGVVEFTICSLIDYVASKWNDGNNDLTALKVGILGLGDLGSKIAKTLQVLGVKCYYYSKTRKFTLENENLVYLPLDELLKTVDAISINLNRDVCLIGGDKLEKFGNNKMIVNTAIGHCYEKSTLVKWLENMQNYYVCDKASINNDFDLLELNNVLYTDRIVGDTKQCLDRATAQILQNLENALK